MYDTVHCILLYTVIGCHNTVVYSQYISNNMAYLFNSEQPDFPVSYLFWCELLFHKKKDK